MNKKSFLMKKEYILLLVTLTVILFFFSHFAEFGFKLSEYLANISQLSLVISYLLIYLGFTDVYRRVRVHKCSKITDALKTYLSLAFAMSGIYYLISISHSGCFAFPEETLNSVSILDYIYFSFVTVTTVGYGDIVPLHTFVRVLVLLQVLSGLLLVIKATSRSSKSS